MKAENDQILKQEKDHMSEKKTEQQEPLPGRMEALRTLPADVLRTLTKQEIRAFLFKDEWPDSMKDKLKQYMVED